MKRFFSRIAVLALATLVATLIGCGSDSPSYPVSPVSTSPLVSAVKTGSFTSAELQSALEQTLPNVTGFSSSLGGEATATPVEFKSIIDSILNFFKKYMYYDIDVYKITYDGAGYKGLTGLLVVPKDSKDPARRFPMLAYQHPTQVLRKMSPSNFGIGPGQILVDDQLTIPLALVLGRAGYITVVADYPGLGDNKDVHPYCTKSLGPVVTAMMKATRQQLGNEGRSTAWNGDLYLTGYSEGGYATAVTAQDVQKNYSGEYQLKTVAPLDGPHSLSEVMRGVMLHADEKYSAPYFLPFVIAGYGAAYGSTIPVLTFEKAIINPMVTNPDTHKQESFNPNLYTRLDGSFKGSEINSYIRLVQPYIGPRSILTTDFMTQLNSSTSSVFGALRTNDAVYGWTPGATTKVTFFHNLFDDLVPYENTTVAVKEWEKQSNVDHVPFMEFIPGLGSVHAGALVPAVVRGFLLIDKTAYPDRQALVQTAQTINLTLADSGKTLLVRQNDLIMVTLDGNPSTGYGWSVADGTGTVLAQVGEPKYTPKSTDPMTTGSGGSYLFTFKVAQQGNSTLKLIYTQAWNTGGTPAQTFNISVVAGN